MYEPEVLVEAADLVRTYGGVRAVDGASLQIRRGQTFGLVGESGSGKSTLSALLLALEKPTAGSVTFDGTDLSHCRGKTLRELRARMQLVMQDPVGALNRRKTVGQIVALPLAVHHRQASAASRRMRVGELLDVVGLSGSFAGRYPHELSGGQCQRVGIARALALNPDFVVLDEPVSAIDVAMQAQILNLLRALQTEFGLTYLFISHDLAVVRYMSPWVAVMHHGRLIEQGPREAVFDNPTDEYTRSLIAAAPSRLAARGAAPDRLS